MPKAFAAMMFARHAHRDQRRKYTNNPYIDHLAEVAGIVAATDIAGSSMDTIVSVAWLHDCIEDQRVDVYELATQFGQEIAQGVLLLSDLETNGNRAERKAASRARLAAAPGWVQSIKCADLISNTSSIVQHDPKFAVTYLEEKRLLLNAMIYADGRLARIARDQSESIISL